MNTVNDEKQYEIIKTRDVLRKFRNESEWIRQNFYGLTFFKRLTALNALETLDSEIKTTTHEIARLEKDDGRQI